MPKYYQDKIGGYHLYLPLFMIMYACIVSDENLQKKDLLSFCKG